MLGLVFDRRPARLAVAGALSRVRPVAALSGFGPLRPSRVCPTRNPPGPGWLVLEPRHAGICGSDVTQATLQADLDNPLSGLVSFPHVMGHEVVASVLEPAGSDLGAGETVVLNPWLGCAPRGIAPCPACSDGMLPLCAHGGEPIPGIGGAGIHTGNIRGLPGGMGTRMVAHHSQLRRLPEGLDSRAGVLADPLAVGLHAGERALGGSSEVGSTSGGGAWGGYHRSLGSRIAPPPGEWECDGERCLVVPGGIGPLGRRPAHLGPSAHRASRGGRHHGGDG